MLVFLGAISTPEVLWQLDRFMYGFLFLGKLCVFLETFFSKGLAFFITCSLPMDGETLLVY